MNFLLHYEFALVELSDVDSPSLGAVGAMLPDLWRMADRKVRPKPIGEDRSAASPELGALLDGIDHHVTIDRWFHRSRTFTEGERDLRSRFFETKSPKLLLFAHAAWEMCLDGALIRQRGLAAVRSDVGEALRASEPHLSRAAELHHWGDGTREESDRTRFDERMKRIIALGQEGSLYEDYLHPSGIARRLAGMRMAFGLGAPRQEELEAWARALEASSEAAEGALTDLRRERSAHRAEGPR